MSPVSEDELRSGRRDFALRVQWFLNNHSGIGYSVEEITFELGALGLFTEFSAIQTALNRLEDSGRVISGDVEGEIYYSYDRRIGFRTS